VASDTYAVINANEALHPLLDACQTAGLHIAGTINVKDDGARIKGFAVIGNPEAVIEVLQDTGDYLLMGFQFEFRHDGTSAVRITPAAVRVVCSNTNLWGEFLPALTLRHVGTPELKVEAVAKFLQDNLALVPTIKQMVDEAAVAPLGRLDLLHAALGAGMSLRHVEALNEPGAFARFEPSLKETGLTAWLGYNVLTAYGTHTELSDTERADSFLTHAAGLLTPTGVAELVAKGKERAKAYAEQRARQQADPKARKTIPAIVGITS
jgi:hypothetical protein